MHEKAVKEKRRGEFCTGISLLPGQLSRRNLSTTDCIIYGYPDNLARSYTDSQQQRQFFSAASMSLESSESYRPNYKKNAWNPLPLKYLCPPFYSSMDSPHYCFITNEHEYFHG
jgi:hypothetical protein